MGLGKNLFKMLAVLLQVLAVSAGYLLHLAPPQIPNGSSTTSVGSADRAPMVAKAPQAAVQCSTVAFVLVCQVSIGSPQQPLKVLFDTGSSTFWVRSSLCTTPSCQSLPKFDPTASSSFVDLPENIRSSAYIDGSSITCTVDSDTLHIGTFQLKTDICLARDIDTSGPEMDGIMGLSLLGTSEAAYVPQNLFPQTETTAAIAFEYSASGGRVYLGAEATAFPRKIQYIETQEPSRWLLSLNSIKIGTSELDVPPQSVLIDTGSSAVFLPNNLLTSLKSSLSLVETDGIYYVECPAVEKLDPVSITFGGVHVILSGEQQVKRLPQGCLSIFQTLPGSSSQIIFGALFLRSFYTIFDYDGARVGFGSISGATLSATDNQADDDVVSGELPIDEGDYESDGTSEDSGEIAMKHWLAFISVIFTLI